MTNEIQWEEGAVCCAHGEQWFSYKPSSTLKYIGYNLANGSNSNASGVDWISEAKDFQLNQIRTGDYIPASQLDTEQKYNDVVEVFGLFGIANNSTSGYEGLASGDFLFLAVGKSGFVNVSGGLDAKRQLTYHQIIAIGKLKRMITEREGGENQSLDDKVYIDIAEVKDRLKQIEDEDLKRKVEEHARIFEDRITELELTFSSLTAEGIDDEAKARRKRMLDAIRGKRADGFEGDYESHPKINHCDIDGTGSTPIRRSNKPVVAEVMLDLTERMEQGVKTYGEALRPHNGRDALQDAYEEALDLACYLKQAMIERNQNK